MKYVMCLLIVGSLFAFAQVPAMPDASGLRSDRKAPEFPVAVLQPAPFEFRGIWIGEEMKEAERKFLALKIPSLSSTPGLDRKSTRLNSSHVAISYAVFCLKKKTKKLYEEPRESSRN